MRKTVGDFGLRISQQLLLVYAIWRVGGHILYSMMMDSLTSEERSYLFREFKQSFALLPLPVTGSALVWTATLALDMILVALMGSMVVVIGIGVVAFVGAPIQLAWDMTISWSDIERWAGRKASAGKPEDRA